jgi:hypothetical protein
MSTRCVNHRDKTWFARHVGGGQFGKLWTSVSLPLNSFHPWQWRAPTVLAQKAAGEHYVAPFRCALLDPVSEEKYKSAKGIAAGFCLSGLKLSCDFQCRYFN